MIEKFDPGQNIKYTGPDTGYIYIGTIAEIIYNNDGDFKMGIFWDHKKTIMYYYQYDINFFDNVEILERLPENNPNRTFLKMRTHENGIFLKRRPHENKA